MTVNDFLEVVDPNRDCDELINIMDHNGNVEVSARSKSKVWDLMGDRKISCLSVEKSTFLVWLEDEHE